MGVIRSAIGDSVLTSMWVFNLPVIGLLAGRASDFLRTHYISLPFTGLFITILLATINVLLFTLLGTLLGGASFNPSTTVSFHAAGLTKPGSSLISMAVRLPAQAAGGAIGAMGIWQVMPVGWLKGGPSLKVDWHTGALAEGLLAFAHCLSVLVVVVRGPRSVFVKVLLLAMVTTGLVRVGSGYTGPSLNPANAFGWAYVKNWHNSLELYYVYWVGPLVGATMAAWVFRVLFAPSLVKKKKKKKKRE
ncbi:aquaporin SIP1-1-like [Carica papaya]|uniref:aquaporin SIP1-1-like n=1 Tax=Carica papaya TaxID=3649 RepID=UPI000B8C9F48|nr:aquaporin SIP1-1-like [Carica papaya]